MAARNTNTCSRALHRVNGINSIALTLLRFPERTRVPITAGTLQP